MQLNASTSRKTEAQTQKGQLTALTLDKCKRGSHFSPDILPDSNRAIDEVRPMNLNRREASCAVIPISSENLTYRNTSGITLVKMSLRQSLK